MPRIWSPEAEGDLFDIWDDFYSRASRRVGDKVLQSMHHVCFVLGGWPEYGKTRDDVRFGLRSVRVDRYVIFYRVTNAIEIVRVMDERRDVDAIFPEGI